MSAEKLGAPNAQPGSRRSTIDTLFVRKAEPTSNAVATNKDRVRTGAIAAMGTTLKALTEGAESATRLQTQINDGAVVIDIDPARIDASMVTDRLAADVDPGFDRLVESVRESGQQVPVLVRPGAAEGRFQIVYGRRRLKAAAALGIKVKAVVRKLTDDELVVAQGRENLDRRDLSFMEKALFALRLEEGGFARSVIIAALSTDKSDLSRYIAIARAIPRNIVTAIGPAGKAGRARWNALAERLADPDLMSVAGAVIASDDFRKLDSDARFAMIFDRVSRSKGPRTREQKTWTNARGQRAGRVEHGSDRTTLVIDENVVPDFGHYLADRLDELYAQFLKQRKKGG